MRLSFAAALAPLRHRNFAILWTASLISNVGSWMQTVAVGALVVSRTGQASWAVLVAAGAFLPIGLLSPVGGALADRLPRRPVIATGNLAAGLIAAAIAGLVATGHDGPPALLALVTLQGSVAALIGPFSQAILPDLVPRPEFLAASSLNSAQWNAGRHRRPGAGGRGRRLVRLRRQLRRQRRLLPGRRHRPALRPAGATAGNARPASQLDAAGLRAVSAQPSCRAATISIGVVAFLAAPFIALVPAVALSLSHGGAAAVAATTATLTTAQGAGAVAGALCLPAVALRIGRPATLAWSIGLLPAALVGYGAAGTVWLAAAALFVVGLLYMGVLSGLQTVAQLQAPAAYRGRVLSFFLVALGVAYPLGALAQGPVANRVGVGWTTAGSAVILAVAALLVAWRRPGFVSALLAPEPAGPPGPPEPAGLVDPAGPSEPPEPSRPPGTAEPPQHGAVHGTRPRMAR